MTGLDSRFRGNDITTVQRDYLEQTRLFAGLCGRGFQAQVLISGGGGDAAMAGAGEKTPRQKSDVESQFEFWYHSCG